MEAFVLITVKHGAVKDTVVELENMRPIVKWAMAVTGPYDIIAAIEFDNPKMFGDILANRINRLEGVRDMLTCVAVSVE